MSGQHIGQGFLLDRRAVTKIELGDPVHDFEGDIEIMEPALPGDRLDCKLVDGPGDRRLGGHRQLIGPSFPSPARPTLPLDLLIVQVDLPGRNRQGRQIFSRSLDRLPATKQSL